MNGGNGAIALLSEALYFAGNGSLLESFAEVVEGRECLLTSVHSANHLPIGIKR